MTDNTELNANMIAQYREHNGILPSGAPIVLLHNVGRRSGKEYITPLAYLADDNDPSTIYVFASKAGAPAHPDWYHNVVAAGRARVEVRGEDYEADVIELTGQQRDEVFAEQVRRMPNFGDYERATAGIRTIPVIALRRASSN